MKIKNTPEAVILAAGRGSRLRPLTDTVPKPLLKVGGIPIIERVIVNLKQIGISRFHIVLGYLNEKIIKCLGNGAKFDIQIDYVYQSEDTIGIPESGLYFGASVVDSDFVFCLCGDDLIEISHAQQLMSLLGTDVDGAMIVKTVFDAGLPGVILNDCTHIVGVSNKKYAPILIYDFVIRTDVLRYWVSLSSQPYKPLIYSLEQILKKYKLSAICPSDLITINTLEHLEQARSCLGFLN